ncbi:Oidioi.mRNA.OKI2018_I69.XSR.g13506.t1.cds [Oikopleura dioica]|uniref:Oidioi.mRNA.OKI2018_I69.XSR.g13506.t1.cds n=1 Tax=Oikopleura dioica TaxID=34765 RepID=A0ABN7S723_OIKDI|nr:Oidioi.mRNA.OKI2018_I69.XSR.g13506.t1.cds [Oikopleura dioica]
MTMSKDLKSGPIMKRKRSSEGSRPSKKHRVSFIDEQFGGPEIRRIPSNTSLPGSSSPTALKRRPSSESIPSPRSEKSLTRTEKMLRMARPEGSPRMRPLPPSIPEPTTNDREAAYNAIKEAINANIENVTDEDRLSLITRISRRKRRTSSSNLGQS